MTFILRAIRKKKEHGNKPITKNSLKGLRIIVQIKGKEIIIMTGRTREMTGMKKVFAGAILAIVIMMLGLMLGGLRTEAARRRISKSKAKSIAVKHAGFKKSKVKFTKAKYDKEDNEYEIKFVKGSYKYEYDINAKTGKIKDWEKEKISKSKKKSGKYIGAAKAQAIALQRAGFDASQVTFTKVKLDKEDGKKVYEIEFIKDNKEYEFTINAKTGKIMEIDVDLI